MQEEAPRYTHTRARKEENSFRLTPLSLSFSLSSLSSLSPLLSLLSLLSLPDVGCSRISPTTTKNGAGFPREIKVPRPCFYKRASGKISPQNRLHREKERESVSPLCCGYYQGLPLEGRTIVCLLLFLSTYSHFGVSHLVRALFFSLSLSGIRRSCHTYVRSLSLSPSSHRQYSNICPDLIT